MAKSQKKVKAQKRMKQLGNNNSKSTKGLIAISMEDHIKQKNAKIRNIRQRKAI